MWSLLFFNTISQSKGQLHLSILASHMLDLSSPTRNGPRALGSESSVLSTGPPGNSVTYSSFKYSLILTYKNACSRISIFELYHINLPPKFLISVIITVTSSLVWLFNFLTSSNSWNIFYLQGWENVICAQHFSNLWRLSITKILGVKNSILLNILQYNSRIMLYTIDQLNFKIYISESEFSSSPLVFLKLYAP